MDPPCGDRIFNVDIPAPRSGTEFDGDGEEGACTLRRYWIRSETGPVASGFGVDGAFGDVLNEGCT